MLKSCRYFYLLVLGFCTAFDTVSAVAQPAASRMDRLFTIQNIKVDETARSANAARTIAIEKAERIAYDKILEKLTQPEDREKLPALSKEALRTLILGLEIVQEQTSSRRYLGQMNVRFEPTLFSNYLGRHNVPHILSAGKGILILHAHSRGLEQFMWSQDTLLNDARTRVDWSNRIRPYVFPLGALKERLAVTPSMLETAPEDKILEIAADYKLDTVLVINSQWRPLATDGSGGAYVAYSYRLSGSNLTGHGQVTQEGAGEEDHLVKMYENILRDVETSWRQQLIVDTGTGGQMALFITSETLDHYTQVMSRLKTVSLVSDIRITEIAIPLSRISFRYTGNKDQLGLALKFAGLKLRAYGEALILETF